MKAAFPNAKAGFFDIVMERVKENGFSDQRLIDAVNNLIDNFRYPNPMVSDIVSFDKRIKLHTHSEVCNKIGQGYRWEDFEIVERNNTKFWIIKSEK